MINDFVEKGTQGKIVEAVKKLEQDWGALPAAPHICLIHAAMFLCCQIGPFRPSSALGVGTGFLLPRALDSPPTHPPPSENSGHPSAFHRTLFTGQLFPDLG